VREAVWRNGISAQARTQPYKGGEKMANQVGKRYICKKCNAEYIVTRAGEGELKCCNQPTEIKK
jgi:hypothetical protein